jgi:hypothetical protein
MLRIQYVVAVCATSCVAVIVLFGMLRPARADDLTGYDCLQRTVCQRPSAEDCTPATSDCANHTCCGACPGIVRLTCVAVTGKTCHQEFGNLCALVPVPKCKGPVPGDEGARCYCDENDPIGLRECGRAQTCVQQS